MRDDFFSSGTIFSNPPKQAGDENKIFFEKIGLSGLEQYKFRSIPDLHLAIRLCKLCRQREITGICTIIKPDLTLRRLIIVPGGLITSTGVVLVVLVLVFVVPGAVF